MNLAERLTSKVGPLPLWVWVVIGVAAILGFRWYRNRKAAAAGAAAGATGSTGATGAIDPQTGYVTGSPSDLAALAAQQNSAGIDPNTGLPYASGLTSGQGDAGPIGPTGATGPAGPAGAPGASSTSTGSTTLGPWKSYPTKIRPGYKVEKIGNLYYEVPGSATTSSQPTGTGGTHPVTGTQEPGRLGPWSSYPKEIRPGYKVEKVGKDYYEVKA